jgi:hypothetical protein
VVQAVGAVPPCLRPSGRASLGASVGVRLGSRCGAQADLDPAATINRKVAAARDAVIDRRILAGAEPVIEVLRDLRPTQPWDTVVRRLNSLDVPRPGGGAWSRDSIIRVPAGSRATASSGRIC